MGNKSSKKKGRDEKDKPVKISTSDNEEEKEEPDHMPEALPPINSSSATLHRDSSFSRQPKKKSQSMQDLNPKSNLGESLDNTNSVTGHIISDIKTYYSYEAKDQLGKGHFGKVYRATNVQHGYVVALKVVAKSGLKGNRLASLRNEINIMKSLKHDNIVRLYEALEDTQNVYFAVELCTGGELFNAIVSQPEAHFTVCECW